MRKRLFCVIGLNSAHRQRAIEKVKREILKDKASSLNTHVFYSHELTIEKARELLSAYSFEERRVIIFKRAQDLPLGVTTFLLKELKNVPPSNCIIFEIEREYAKFINDKKVIANKFFPYILRVSTVMKMHSYKEDISVNKLLFAVRKNDASWALYILERLFIEFKNSSALSLQILGALTRNFSFTPNPGVRKKYFNLIWETDRLIKEKGIDSRLALERLITKIITQ